ncbi:uncharacterized protein LOC119076156 [Bradysia coprophila]|uniref:uncharacterized protein LOC119076156 n=1 Tax=Bradysia coprophila TaxID=38358 RepID=UPI00187DA966|nr:uncharacterized protein LOC119076156 [Bradysia coprophila]
MKEPENVFVKSTGLSPSTTCCCELLINILFFLFVWNINGSCFCVWSSLLANSLNKYCNNSEDRTSHIRMIVFGFCGILLLNVVLGLDLYVADSVAKIHPDHPGKCWIEETQMIYKPGETFTPKTGCRKMLCTYDGNLLILVYRRCPAISNQSNCKYVVKKPDLEYPACCPEIIC